MSFKMIGLHSCSYIRYNIFWHKALNSNGKGVRFDVYSEDDTGTVFDCEMQTMYRRI